MQNKKNSLSTISILIGFILLFWLLSIYIINYLFPSWELKAFFGDSFGAINALFSGLAFGGIIYTILLQREELGLQREELANTRQELKRTADAQEEMIKYQNEQMRLSIIPLFEINPIERERYSTCVKNISTNIAFDVEISIYYEIPEYLNINGHLLDHPSTRNVDITKKFIKQRCYYNYFGNQKLIFIPMIDRKNINYDNSYIVIQYKDSLRNIYYNLISLERKETSEDRIYHGNIIKEIQPSFFKPLSSFDSLHEINLNEHKYLKEIGDFDDNYISIKHLAYWGNYNENWTYPMLDIN